MKRLALFIVVLLSILGLASVSLAQRSDAASNPAPLNKMPKDLEERYALSALPPHLCEEATVYLLDPARGYMLDRKGTNGFSCFVERIEQERADFRNDVYAAVCFDAEGSEKIVPVWMDTAKMRAEGN
jgi:hypothetical protein